MDTSELQTVFPKTIELLLEKRIGYLQDQFDSTLHQELLGSTSEDPSRWFPVFLKFQGVRPDILEVAEFEYVRHSVKAGDPGPAKSDAGQVRLNPSMQFIELKNNQPKLGRSSGLYCFFKKEGSFLEFRLGISEALIVDLLHEERKYSLNQLAHMAHVHIMGDRYSFEQWTKIIQDMIHLGVLTLKDG